MVRPRRLASIAGIEKNVCVCYGQSGGGEGERMSLSPPRLPYKRYSAYLLKQSQGSSAHVV